MEKVLKLIYNLIIEKGEGFMRVVRIAASCIGLLTTFGTLTSMAADVSTPFIQQEAARADVICTHFPGHILFTSLNTWMLPCILQGASILFFSESFYYCNS